MGGALVVCADMNLFVIKLNNLLKQFHTNNTAAVAVENKKCVGLDWNCNFSLH